MEKGRAQFVMLILLVISGLSFTLNLYDLWPEELAFLDYIVFPFAVIGFCVMFFIYNKKYPGIVQDLFKKLNDMDKPKKPKP